MICGVPVDMSYLTAIDGIDCGPYSISILYMCINMPFYKCFFSYFIYIHGTSDAFEHELNIFLVEFLVGLEFFFKSLQCICCTVYII